MNITSTRSKISINSSTAIIKGISDDKGLFVFKDIDMSFFNSGLLSLPYQNLANKLFRVLLKDYPQDDISYIINKAYNKDNFNPNIVDIKSFNDYSILSLYNGPTFAFKDMALSILPLLFSTAKSKSSNSKPTLILTATSGDTGSAALSGFSQNDNTYIIVLYPRVGVSKFQELQMNSYQSDKHLIFSVDGNFDDCQKIVKDLFQNTKTTNIDLSSANSINIGRLVPQIVYYIYSYLELVRTKKIKFNDKINITVPSGNFGNIYAAFLAKKFGVPINKLIIASNENNVLTELFSTGYYKTNRTLEKTSSPSMDILVSSNVERYFYNLFNSDTVRVNEVMNKLADTGEVFVEEILSQTDFYAGYTTELETIKQIKTTLEDKGCLIDPHTAVAVNVYEKYLKDTNDDTYTIIVSTASPFKFSDAICKALDLPMGLSLEETINLISEKTNTKVDPRIISVINSTSSKLELSIETAYKELQRLIGEIDAEN